MDKYLEVNNAFHKVIAEASDNVVLYELIVNMLSRSFVYLVLFGSFFELENNPSLDEHREIVKALKEHNEDKAVELVRSHILSSCKSVDDLTQKPRIYQYNANAMRSKISCEKIKHPLM